MVTHLRLLCAGLAGRGVRTAIASPSDLGVQPFHAAPITSKPHPLRDLVTARLTARLARDYDLIHGHGLRGAWIAALAARFARKPFVFTAHNLAPQNPGALPRYLLRYVVSRASRVICISQSVSDSLKTYGLTPSQTDLIPNGIDLTPFDRPIPVRANNALTELPAEDNTNVGALFAPAPHTPTLASLGRLSPEKGFDVLVEAARLVVEKGIDTRFVLAGDGPEREDLEEQIRDSGVEGRFTLVGRMEDSPGFLLAADAVIVPSLQEGQGLVALEAMAARKPVIASAVGGLLETVEDGITGLLVPPGEPAALADAIERLLAEPESWAVLGEAGRTRVEAYYTADRMVSRTIDVYNSIVRPDKPQ